MYCVMDNVMNYCIVLYLVLFLIFLFHDQRVFLYLLFCPSHLHR
jgi:hypothetical protein